MTFCFLCGSKNFCKLLCVSCEVFALHGYVWIHWVAKSCTKIASRWLCRDSLSSLRLVWSAVIKSPKCSALGTTVPVRLLEEALVLLSSSKCHNFGLSGSEKRYCAYPNPVPLLLAAPQEVHEMTWKCLDFLALGFTKALLKYFHRPNSLWIPMANQAIHAMYLFVLLRVPHFYACFRFLWIHAAGFREALHSYFHFFLLLDFRCICWHQIRNPVMKMMEK